MKILLDIRFRVRSGASSYISGLLPKLFAQSVGQFEFMVLKYQGQQIDHVPEDMPAITVPMKSAGAELLWINRQLPRLMKKHRIDLYHSMKLFGPVKSPVPMIHTAQSITRRRRGEFPLTLKQRLSYGVYGSHLYKKSRCVIAVSDYVKDFLTGDLNIPEENVAVIYNGIDDAFCQRVTTHAGKDRPRPFEGNAPYIICVGNLEPVKNHITAVRALARVADRLPHHLVIAGRDDKPCVGPIRELIREERLQDRVHFTGFLNRDTLVDYMLGAQMMLHPSLSEGMGIAVLEGMCCGLPIIGSDIPGIREAAGDTGLYVQPKDVDGFARAITQAAEDQPLRQSLARQGRRQAASFTWDRAAGQTLKLYHQYTTGLRHAPFSPSVFAPSELPVT